MSSLLLKTKLLNINDVSITFQSTVNRGDNLTLIQKIIQKGKGKVTLDKWLHHRIPIKRPGRRIIFQKGDFS